MKILKTALYENKIKNIPHTVTVWNELNGEMKNLPFPNLPSAKKWILDEFGDLQDDAGAGVYLSSAEPWQIPEFEWTDDDYSYTIRFEQNSPPSENTLANESPRLSMIKNKKEAQFNSQQPAQQPAQQSIQQPAQQPVVNPNFDNQVNKLIMQGAEQVRNRQATYQQVVEYIMNSIQSVVSNALYHTLNPEQNPGMQSLNIWNQSNIQ